MVNVKTYKCFPTSIHEAKMNISDFDRNNMIAYIKKTEACDTEFHVKHTMDEHYKDDELHRLSYFNPLVENILLASEKIFKEGGYSFDKLEITNMWGNTLKTGEVHPPHTHSNNVLSGVYYLQSGSPIQFFDPRPSSSVLKPRNAPDWNNSSMVQFNSAIDIALFFPSWLMHWVPPTSSERISVSWNILIRGHYGEPHTLQNAHI